MTTAGIEGGVTGVDVARMRAKVRAGAWRGVACGGGGGGGVGLGAEERSTTGEERTSDVDAGSHMLRLAIVAGLKLGELLDVLLYEGSKSKQHVAAITTI